MVLCLLLALGCAASADQFGSIAVVPQVLVSGETCHGYRELRVLVDNVSAKDRHRVTLVYPDHSYDIGNSIGRVSRTLVLNPGSRANVPLWIPPLPENGNGLLRVEIDDEDPETVSVPRVSAHMGRYRPAYGRGEFPATVLVSRTLDFDSVQRQLTGERGSCAASAATGAPDYGGGRLPTKIWMPDGSTADPQWLELKFDKPMAADHLRIYQPVGSSPGGEAVLTGISGSNVLRVPLQSAPHGRRRGRSPGNPREIVFARTPEPIGSVRLEFAASSGGILGIDAVQLVDSIASDAVWAGSARASSESPLAKAPRALWGGGGEDCSLLRAEIPVAQWSEHWLSYSPFDAVALGAADLKAMPAPGLEALWRYTECGGTLLIFGGADVPAPWRSFRDQSFEGGRELNVGFGRCYLVASDAAAEMNPALLKAVEDTLAASTRYWQSLPDESAANSTFPVIESVGVPVRGTVFIMLVFVILIGPVNLFVLSRLNRRTWLLWTIPAISLLTCLSVFGYSLLREGVTSTVRTEGLTLLDQVNRRACSEGTTAFYCPLTPSGGLSFGFDTEATPLVELWNRASSARRDVDWTQSQNLQRGWGAARVPAFFRLRKVETRRERLELEASGGQAAVINGLGAAIRSLRLADASGRIYEASHLAPGQRAVLSPCADTPAVTERRGPRELLNRVGCTPSKGVVTSAAAFLLPGTYVAELDSNPFLENGLAAGGRTTRSRERALVYGILER